MEKPVEWLSERVQEKGEDLPVEDLVRFLCIHVSEREAVHAFDDTCVLVQTALLVTLAHVSKREGVSDES